MIDAQCSTASSFSARTSWTTVYLNYNDQSWRDIPKCIKSSSKVSVFWSDFNHNRVQLTHGNKNFEYNISQNSSHWESLCPMQTDRHRQRRRQADRQTNRHSECNSFLPPLFANVSKRLEVVTKNCNK